MFNDSYLHYIFMNELLSVPIIKKIVERGLLFRYFGRENETVLHILCSRHYITYDMISAVIHPNYVEDFYIENIYGETPLHYLLENRALTTDIVQKLINSNIRNFEYKSVNDTDDIFQDTPLHYLFRNDSMNQDILSILVNQRYNINVLNKAKQTPLHYYCSSDIFTIENFTFLQNNFSLNITCEDIFDNSPMDQLCKNNTISFEIIKSLTTEGIIKKSNFDKAKNRFSDDQCKKIYSLTLLALSSE